MASTMQLLQRQGVNTRTPVSRTRRVQVNAVGSTYGANFRVTTFGESHGKGVGCVVDGVPPRLAITTEEIQAELDRRRPGQSIITTPRKEEDTCEILSGVFDGVTLGTPIAVLVRNKDQRSQDYSEMSVAYRPSHADATYDFKYGIRAIAGGGRSSARETIGRVAAGAIAKKLLKVVGNTEVSTLHVSVPTAFGQTMHSSRSMAHAPTCFEVLALQLVAVANSLRAQSAELWHSAEVHAQYPYLLGLRTTSSSPVMADCAGSWSWLLLAMCEAVNSCRMHS